MWTATDSSESGLIAPSTTLEAASITISLVLRVPAPFKEPEKPPPVARTGCVIVPGPPPAIDWLPAQLRHRATLGERVAAVLPSLRWRPPIARAASSQSPLPTHRATTLLVRRWGALADSQTPQKVDEPVNVGYVGRTTSPGSAPASVRPTDAAQAAVAVCW